MPLAAAAFAAAAFPALAQNGLTDLGVLNGGMASYAFGVSADGTVVVGQASDGAAGNATRAFRWTRAGGLTSLGTLNGGADSHAKGVSADGAVVVGFARDGGVEGNNERAFRWTQAGGMVNLGVLPGDSYSHAKGVSADGNVVVGHSFDSEVESMWKAFRWTQVGGMVSLGVLNGGSISSAAGVSADGAVVVGYADDGAADNADRAFRWTQAGGMVSLGTLNGGMTSYANAISIDGTVVVGYATDGAAGNAQRAFRWTRAGGMQTVEAWLAAAGVPTALSTSTAYGVSADGSVVVGTLANSQAFIARVSAAGSGLITHSDVIESCMTAARGRAMNLALTGTLIHGAHGRPLARRVAPGQKTWWLAGDWGADEHGVRAGRLGLAEVGVGRNFGPLQVNLSLGQTWARQNLGLDGRAKTEGTYVLAEALAPLAENLWATFGTHYQRGEADLRRGYLNAGLQDFSIGSPNVEARGVRVRLDWEAVRRLAGTDFSPYLDLSYGETRLAAYTETGGGFPARFDASTEKATELRLGVNAVRPLAGDMRLVATLEAAHRFEKRGARSTGQLVGLFGFDLPGEAVKRDWLRAGIGVEGKLAEGTAAISLNATTEGAMPNVWIAASWQRAF